MEGLEPGSYLDVLEQQIDYCNQNHQWIKVDDRLPQKRDWVLVVVDAPHIDTRIVSEGYLAGSFHLKTAYWHTKDRKYGFSDTLFRVTHWMPLPKPPTEKE